MLDADALTIDALRSAGSIKWSLFPEAIGAFVAEMDFGTAPAVTATLHRAVDDAAFGYLPPHLEHAMAGAAADWQRDRYGWPIGADRIHPLPDVLKGLEVAIARYSAPGSPVILPTPAYMPFRNVIALMDREVIEVPLALEGRRYTLDLAGIEAAFAAGAGLLVLCNPYNPVGRVFNRAELTDPADVVTRTGGRVFSDEIHAPLTFPGHEHVPYASLSVETAAHTITATSASKAWNLAGLKCAQIILSSDADAARWEEFGHYVSHGASTLGVIANTVAFTQGAAWLDEVIAYLDGNRIALADLLADRIPEIRYTPPEGTYIGWLDARELGLDVAPAEFFRERARVALTDGANTGEPGRGFVRFILATPRPIIEEAVDRMAGALGR